MKAGKPEVGENDIIVGREPACLLYQIMIMEERGWPDNKKLSIPYLDLRIS